MTDKEMYEDLQYLWSIGAPHGILGELLGKATPERLKEQILFWFEVGPDTMGHDNPGDAQDALEIFLYGNKRVKMIAKKYREKNEKIID